MKNNNKHGFTLAELLGVIVIISLIAFIVLPPIINQITKSENLVDEVTSTLIREAANLYVDFNSNDLPLTDGRVVCVKVVDITRQGFLESPLKYANGANIDEELYVGGTVVRGNLTDLVIEQAVDPEAPTILGVPSGFTNEDVDLEIEALGSGTCSGIYKIEYRIDGGEWQTYTGTINFADEGVYAFDARAISYIDGVSPISSETIRID